MNNPQTSNVQLRCSKKSSSGNLSNWIHGPHWNIFWGKSTFLPHISVFYAAERTTQRLDQLISIDAVMAVIMFAIYSAAFLSFWRAYVSIFVRPHYLFRLEIVQIQAWSSASASHAMFYDRNHLLYPYKSHGQWLKASYGWLCLIMLLFNGVPVRPFETQNFVVSYISASLSFDSKFHMLNVVRSRYLSLLFWVIKLAGMDCTFRGGDQKDFVIWVVLSRRVGRGLVGSSFW